MEPRFFRRGETPPAGPWEGLEVAPPRGVLGRVVALEAVVGRSPKAAVGVASATVYPTGFELVLSVHVRDKELCEFLSNESLTVHGLLRERTEELPPELFRHGIAFSDGSSATVLRPYPEDSDRSDAGHAAGPILVLRTGVGDGNRWRLDWWVAPLPPPGPLAFVCEWPVAEIPLSRVEVDAAPIREAASGAVVLWE